MAGCVQTAAVIASCEQKTRAADAPKTRAQLAHHVGGQLAHQAQLLWETSVTSTTAWQLLQTVDEKVAP